MAEEKKDPRCKKDGGFLIKQMVPAPKGKRYWKCPHCKNITIL